LTSHGGFSSSNNIIDYKEGTFAPGSMTNLTQNNLSPRDNLNPF